MKIMMYMMIVASTIFLILNHPLSLGSTLLFQTILLAAIMGSMNLSFWFSYILFLVMIGGMLILFIYMTSVASNEKFKFSMKTSIMTLVMMTIMLPMQHENLSDLWIKTQETLLFNNNFHMNMLNKYFNFPYSMMATFLMIYLFLVLIVVVKMTKKNFGPLRQNK